MSMEDDALRAIAGADTVRNRMLAYIESGACGLKDACYAIKSRTKRPEGLVKKIDDRRQAGKPNYAATDARDIVGVRLLALHYAGMKSICFKLIDFLNFGLQPMVGLFSGTSINDIVEEIIVYSAPTSGPVYRDIYSYLSTLGIGTEAQPKVKWTEYPPERPYSSIHIVLKAFGSDIPARPFIPVEVQIRTSLEDTWAEIDHSRKYKSEQSHGTINTNGLFNNLKHSIDSSLFTIDTIIDLHDQVDSDRRARSSEFTSVRKTNRLDVPHKISPKAPNVISAEVERINTDIEEMAITFEAATSYHPETISFGDSILTELRDVDHRYRAYPEHGDDEDFRYWSGMETAFVHAWLYRHSFLNPQVDIESRHKHIRACISTYEGLELIYSTDAWLKFRLSTAMMMDGHVDLAIEKGMEGYRLLPNDPRLSEEKVLQSVVARQLGYFYWLKKQQSWSNARRLGAVWLSARLEEQMLRSAFEVTAQAFRYWHDAKPSALKESSKNLLLGNIACFAWELKEIYASPVPIRSIHGLVEALGDYLDEHDVRDMPIKTGLADSLMKAAMLLSRYDVATRMKNIVKLDPDIMRMGQDLSEFLRYCVSVVEASLPE